MRTIPAFFHPTATNEQKSCDLISHILAENHTRIPKALRGAGSDNILKNSGCLQIYFCYTMRKLIKPSLSYLLILRKR